MRILVLGGTVFVSYTVAAEALRRGHEVVCAARGTSGNVPDGAKLVVVDRDDPGGLAPLAGERFDAVVDVAKISHPWVVRALDALAGTAAHWTFVSSVSAYADETTIGQDATAPLLEPLESELGPDEELTDPHIYGSIKVASENAVRDRLADRAFVVRPGLITGTGDPTDRFGYWPARMHRGGRVLVPDTDLSSQIIDVRDLATWIVDAAENRLTGNYDAISVPAPLPEMLAEIAAAVGADDDVELVRAAPEALEAAKVNYWSGPRSLPLWLPPSWAGLDSHDPTASLNAGLRIRPLADAARAALDHERTLGLDRERKSGLSPAEEAEILAGL
ncbi:MAG TPA: NAD-dependent epimerase/dehydratase family protein [Actinophytocola sp.]|jgi:nucleoside-diphosphate-sugar epimerase|uniref:NAD-dependent epimerase/dehydratase family protein n=1 Tax=Actinophytocola sp. TaxID=1872138 RepID=UPI002DFDF4A0|nr:NAD-dependent epimerase/dehydratase family protein [Actinophytocola sp.]